MSNQRPQTSSRFQNQTRHVFVVGHVFMCLLSRQCFKHAPPPASTLFRTFDYGEYTSFVGPRAQSSVTADVLSRMHMPDSQCAFPHRAISHKRRSWPAYAMVSYVGTLQRPAANGTSHGPVFAFVVTENPDVQTPQQAGFESHDTSVDVALRAIR